MSEPQKATLTGAWYALLGPKFEGPKDRISYAFTAYGSYRLTLGTTPYYLDFGEPGCFTDVMKDGKKIDWKAVGTAQFKDKDGDKLFVGADEKDGDLIYVMLGGSGKWAKAQGSFVVRSVSTFMDETVIRTFEEGIGQVTI